MFPHHNPLPKPELLTTLPFEALLASVKAQVLAYLQQHAPDDVAAVSQTFANEAELLTKLVEAFSVILQNHMRQQNHKALEMFGMYATEQGMVDLIASQLGVVRQVLDPGDPNAFPPVPPTLESNDSVLTRYYLAAFALASTGTRSGYRFHAMTLGGRPTIKVESPSPQRVVVTYDFAEHELGGLTKDAQARRVAAGEVDCFILTHAGDGMPEQSLVTATEHYLRRDDIGQETDLITVKAPSLHRWRCQAVLYVGSGADKQVIQAAAEQAVRQYGREQHRLGGQIEPSMLYNRLMADVGAYRGEISQPAQPLRCSYREAPYLESVEITIITENP